jgi:hypothetical protein
VVVPESGDIKIDTFDRFYHIVKQFLMVKIFKLFILICLLFVFIIALIFFFSKFLFNRRIQLLHFTIKRVAVSMLILKLRG